MKTRLPGMVIRGEDSSKTAVLFGAEIIGAYATNPWILMASHIECDCRYNFSQTRRELKEEYFLIG